MILVRREEAQTFPWITPPQDLNRFLPCAPAIHLTARRHVEIDGVPAGKRPAIIVNPINLPCREQTERCSRRPTRPIRGGAADLRRSLRDSDSSLCSARRFGHARRFRCASSRRLFHREWLKTSARIRDRSKIDILIIIGQRQRTRSIFGTANGRSGRVQFSAQRVVIRKLAVI